MGQFKPMVKMETTEPSVELKLKKGGKVAKKADGGMMGSPMSAAGPMPPAMPARGGMPGGMPPMKPSLAMRRRAMRGMPAGAGPAGPIGGAAAMQPSMPAPMAPPMAPPAMKKGGKADMPQDKAMIKKAFKQHDMQEHKGGKGTSLKLKHGGKMATGGVVKGQGGFATGGVAKSNAGGYKKGGKIKKMADGGGLLEKLGGITAPPGNDFSGGGKGGDAMSGLGSVNQGASTIGSALKNIQSSVGGGDGGMGPYPQRATESTVMYKSGGKASKKAYAAGGTVNSGRPVAMPQGNKPASKPVRINQLAGTYKTGGKVMAESGPSGQDKYMVKDPKAVSDKASSDLEEALNPIGMVKELYGKAKKYLMPKSSGSVTKESVTITPGKKRGGSVKC